MKRRGIILKACIFLFTVLTFQPGCKKDENNEDNTPRNTVTDIDGNIYNTVIIGLQTWMAENLKTTKYNDGETIPNITDSMAWVALTSPAYCWYNNDSTAYNATYGALYNWHTVNTGKLCPIGWHVPSDDEWTTLENYLVANGYNYDGTTTDNKYAKSLASKVGWTHSTYEGAIGNADYPIKRNATGFTGHPGGSRYINPSFTGVGNGAHWWSSTETSEIHASVLFLYHNNSNVLRLVNNKEIGFSVRCLKD